MSAYRQDSKVRLTYEMRAAELQRGIRSQVDRPFRTSAMATGLLCSVAATLLILGSPTGGGLAATAGFSLFAALVLWSIRRKPRQQILERLGETFTQRLEADEDAFEIHAPDSGKRVPWDFILQWQETQDDFLLYIDAIHVHVIPKRIFPTPEVETTFRQLLQDRIPADGPARFRAAQRGKWLPGFIALGTLLLVLASILEALVRTLS